MSSKLQIYDYVSVLLSYNYMFNYWITALRGSRNGAEFHNFAQFSYQDTVIQSSIVCKYEELQ